MKWLQGTYTQRFNSRHKMWGHLLQGRYKALLVDGGKDVYFPTVASYIHLNPARAKMFDLQNGKLTDYRWSSYPLYFRPSKRPSWLCVDRVLGSVGLKDNGSGHAAFRSLMQKRVLEIALSDHPDEIDAEWGKIRRGWYYGAEDFRNDLLDKLYSIIGVSGKRESFNGEQVISHDEQAANRLFMMGLKLLNLDDEKLSAMPKSCPEKCCLAWLLRRHTCVTNEWIKKKLHMGTATNFAALVKRVEYREERMIPFIEKLNSIKISD